MNMKNQEPGNMAKKKIIVVEDEFLIALDIKERVEDFGYEVLNLVDSGEKAIEKAEEMRPDLVLMDIGLKGKINGAEAAREILSRFHIPVIFITAHSDEETLRNLREISPFGCFTKPLDGFKLHEKMDEVLSKSFNGAIQYD